MTPEKTDSCRVQDLADPSPERLREIVEEVSSRIYKPILPLEITAWSTPEPVDFKARFSGEKRALQPGDSWGENLFDCAWFRFSAELSPELAGRPLVARIDINGELCITDRDGIPLRGLTCKKSVFERSLGIPAKTVYELPAESLRAGRLELWADAGFNDLFGSLPDGGRIEFAYLAECRRDIRALFYDLECLVDLASDLPQGDPLYQELAAAVDAVEQRLGGYEPEAVSEARTILKPFLAAKNRGRGMQVSAIGHAHLDLAWLWPIRETIRKGARTFATALYNLERYPDYIFGCSQPQLFAWIKEGYPELYSRIRSAVAAGRIEPQGTFWVEPDCNIPCGESFIRQILHGARFFREEFGVVPRFCWQPDVFGYHGQLPQILRKSGHDYFMTQKLSWNVVNRFPYHSFKWRGIDGSEILTHMLPEETYNGPAAPRSLRKIANHYAQRDVSNRALMVFGIGDGGGGPDAEHLERLARAAKIPGLPGVKIEPAAEFFPKWAEASADFPTWTGELYLERHQGTLTTQALVKRNNRRCEIALRELEWAGFLAETFAGLKYPAAELDRLWKEVLLYQFHDILPGSSIKRVYDEANARYAEMLGEMERLIALRYQAVAGVIDPASPRLAFNSLGWDRSEWLRVDGEWRFAQVPAMGSAELTERGFEGTVRAGRQLLENERLRVTFADNGAISSIYHKGLGREVLAPGEEANQFVVFEDTGDAWDFPTDYEVKDVWVYLRQTPQRPRLESRLATVDGPCAVVDQVFSFGNSRIRQRVLLREGGEAIEFETEVDWADPGSVLRVRFPVAVTASFARCEIPFGSIARPTGEDDPVARAQIEVAAQQWVDLSEETFGVALLNDCKYGFRLKGHTLDMCLLRSVPHPGTALIGKEDRSDGSPATEFTDLGQHRFRYALLPHSGGMDEAQLTRAARAFNVPLRVIAGKQSAAARKPLEVSWMRSSNPAIEIVAFKQAENSGWILRLVNVSPKPQEAEIALNLPFTRVTETDLMEAAVSPSRTLGPGEALLVAMAPFEIKTLHLW